MIFYSIVNLLVILYISELFYTMKKLIFLLVLLISSYSFSQQKKIALIIGNSNYVDGKLKNPVNDAILMSQTFQELGFDVMLDTNIETRQDFLTTIRNYQKRREQYKIGIVYYAGHGIQIDGKNFMLATKEKYENKFDVFDNGIDLSILMDEYWLPTKNEVNIFILDACRNNPFESKWNSTRSLNNSSGLAPLKATGALIAYSTESGTTASDGIENDINSIYCQSLVRNLQLENTRIDRVFLNVRNEVRNLTNNAQLPAFYNQLEGEDLILKPTEFTKEFQKIRILIDKKEFEFAQEKLTPILLQQPENKLGLLYKGEILFNTKNSVYDGKELFEANTLYPNDNLVKQYLSRFYSSKNNSIEALKLINEAIKLNSNEPDNYYWKARFLFDLLEYDSCSQIISKAIELDNNRSKFYILKGNSNSILKKYDLAKEQFEKAISIDPNQLSAYYFLSFLLIEQNLIEEAQNVINTGLSKITSDNEFRSDLVILLSESYIRNNDLCHAMDKLEELLISDSLNSDAYYQIGNIYYKTSDYLMAIENYNLAINIHESSNYYLNRGLCYQSINLEELALLDYNNALKFDSTNIRAINNTALLLFRQNKFEKSIDYIKQKLPNYHGEDFEGLSLCYSNLCGSFAALNDFNQSLSYCDSSIKFNTNRIENYIAKINLLVVLEKYEEANELIQKLIKQFPEKKIDLLNEEASIHFEQNKLKKAEEIYLKILKLDNNNDVANYYLGEINLEQENYSIAKDYYTNVITNSSKDFTDLSFSGRAITYKENGLIDSAIRDLRIAIQLNNKNEQYYYDLAYLYYMDKDDAILAIKTLDEGLKNNNLATDLLWLRGDIYNTKLNDSAKAISDLIEIISIDSNYVDAYYWLGDVYLEQKEYKKAENYFKKGIHIDSLDIDSRSYGYWGLSEVYAEQGEYNKVLETLNIWAKSNPNDPDVFNVRGEFYLNFLNDLKLSLIDLQRSYMIDSKVELTLQLLLEIYIKTNNSKEALKIQKELIQLKNEKQDKYKVQYCTLLSHFGYNDEAESEFQKIPENIQLKLNLYVAKYYLMSKDFKGALINFNLAIQNDTLDPEPYYYMSKCFNELNQKEEQIICYSYLAGLLMNLDNSHYVGGLLSDYETIENYQLHFEIGSFFSSLEQNEFACREYRNTLSLLNSMYNWEAIELKKLIDNKISNSCKP